MDFGKVANLDDLDLSLPGDHADTIQLLATPHVPEGVNPTGTKDQRLFLGCAKWGRSDWIGQLYPRGTKSACFLSVYAGNFNSVELNATYHQMPQAERMAGWAAQTGRDFLFCPKIFQGVSHWQRLKGAERLTTDFLRGVDGFGPHLGTLFLQLPPTFSPAGFDTLSTYLEAFPRDRYPLTVEFRHPAWFADVGVYDETFAMLREFGVGAVITDTPGRRDVLHQRLTVPEAFIRFVGGNLHPSDYSRLDDWANRIKVWLDNGIRRIYFFMHHPDELNSPVLVTHFAKLINEVCGLSLTVPTLLNNDPTLFS